MKKAILFTGGAGYIGSHTIYQFCEKQEYLDYDIVVIDNFVNSNDENLKAIENKFQRLIHLYPIDLCDPYLLTGVFRKHSIQCIIHFAGLKAVGESNEIPLKYYENNLQSTFNLLNYAKMNKVPHFIFSSSATVYGNPQYLPIDENHPLQATNPYGRTKWMIEEILKDEFHSPSNQMNIILLRYFNPVSCHPSGILKENPKGKPNNLFPLISQVYQGIRSEVSVFGNDYSTKDGTGIRDYIHVTDLAEAHLSSFAFLQNSSFEIQNQTKKTLFQIFNVGTGNGFSVLEMIHCFQDISKKEIPYSIQPRRQGDVAECYADSNLIQNQTGWKPIYQLKDMVSHEIYRLSK
jgi:UDP-glucose 4-epimerase